MDAIKGNFEWGLRQNIWDSFWSIGAIFPQFYISTFARILGEYWQKMPRWKILENVAITAVMAGMGFKM